MDADSGGRTGEEIRALIKAILALAEVAWSFVPANSLAQTAILDQAVARAQRLERVLALWREVGRDVSSRDA